MAVRKRTTKKTGARPKRSLAKKKPVQERGSRPAAPAKKFSALDAAVQVLAESDRPMNCREMIEAMAEKGYWTSPAGKTPASTLYSAIVRELTTKGREARFQKVERGRFTLSQTAR